MEEYKVHKFPVTRIATKDVCSIGLRKHHIPALIEIDVSEIRKKLKQYKNKNLKLSFTAWLIKVISETLRDHENVTAYLRGNRSRIIFKDINVSITVEKELNGESVPIPLLIEKANELSVESITSKIRVGKDQEISGRDVVLLKKTSKIEQMYYSFPGFLRRYFWQYLIKHPGWAYKKMGNVAITSIGMIGKANGWFIPISIHPICFGIGKITKKPVVLNDEIVIREILNMTVLLDHDVVDGAQMARFINKLAENMEKGTGL